MTLPKRLPQPMESHTHHRVQRATAWTPRPTCASISRYSPGRCIQFGGVWFKGSGCSRKVEKEEEKAVGGL